MNPIWGKIFVCGCLLLVLGAASAVYGAEILQQNGAPWIDLAAIRSGSAASSMWNLGLRSFIE